MSIEELRLKKLEPGQRVDLFAYGLPSWLVGCACGCGTAVQVDMKALATHGAEVYAPVGSDRPVWLLDSLNFWHHHGPAGAICTSWKPGHPNGSDPGGQPA